MSRCEFDSSTSQISDSSSLKLKLTTQMHLFNNQIDSNFHFTDRAFCAREKETFFLISKCFFDFPCQKPWRNWTWTEAGAKGPKDERKSIEIRSLFSVWNRVVTKNKVFSVFLCPFPPFWTECCDCFWLRANFFFPFFVLRLSKCLFSFLDVDSSSSWLEI